MLKIWGAVSKHEQQLKSQAEQIKELQTKKENEDKWEQQKRLIITGLNEEEQKKHFITTVKEKLNIDITETDFSLETKEIQIRPRQNKNAWQSTSRSARNEATNIQQRKKMATLNFALLGRNGKSTLPGQSCEASISSSQKISMPSNVLYFLNVANFDVTNKSNKPGRKTWRFM